MYYIKLSEETDALNRRYVATVYSAKQPRISGDIPVEITHFPPFAPREYVWDGSAIRSSFDRLQTLKLAALDRAALTALANGVSVSGLILAATEADQAAFTKLIVLLREAEEMQPSEEHKAAFRDSIQTIADKTGTTHHPTVIQLRGIVLQYGQAIQTTWTILANRKAAVRAAVTMEELQAA